MPVKHRRYQPQEVIELTRAAIHAFTSRDKMCIRDRWRLMIWHLNIMAAGPRKSSMTRTVL